MSITHVRDCDQDPLRPPATGLKAWLAAWLAMRIPFAFRLARALAPIVRFRNIVLVTRYDDVREVFLNDQAFRVPWDTRSASSPAGCRSSSAWTTLRSIATTSPPS